MAKVTTTVNVNKAVRRQIDKAAAWGTFQGAVAHLAAARNRIQSPPGRSGRATGRMSEGGSATLYMEGAETVSEGGEGRSAADGSGRIVAVVGFPFPARFQETGTAKQPAYPFLGPGYDDLGDPTGIVERAAAEEWPR